MVVRLTQQQFLEEATRLHPTYDFSKSELINNTTKVLVGCPTHGGFNITPKSLRKGCGCKKCSGEDLSSRYTMSNPEFLKRLSEIWGDKYDYSKVEYVGSDTKVSILCKDHGEFLVYPSSCLKNRPVGQVICPRCNKEKVAEGISLTTEQVVSRCKEIHGTKYTYEKTKYINSYTKIIITCPVHGDKEVNPQNFMRGSGCMECGNIKTGLISRNTVSKFIELASSIHDNKYDYSKVVYSGNKKPVDIVCPTHGIFSQKPNSHTTSKAGCPSCSHTFSRAEEDLRQFITSLGVINEKIKLANRKEIDIYCPEKKVGFEYNGLQWHSENKRGKDYHLDKLLAAEEEGITLIQIFEDEWLTKTEIVKNRIRSILGFSERVYARQLLINKVEWPEAGEFLGKTHIQGAGAPTILCYALKDKYNNLVSLMTFAKLRFEKGSDTEYELMRYCSTGTVVGGFSKLLKAFFKEITCTKLVSYSDRRWSVGNVYSVNGFTKESSSPPGYFWCKGANRYNRVGFQKHKLSEKLSVFNPDLSETENCIANGYFKVFDCGMDKWILNNS